MFIGGGVPLAHESLLATSEVRAIHERQVLEHLVCTYAGFHENEFASSHKSDEDLRNFGEGWAPRLFPVQPLLLSEVVPAG
jgi:hypothetical protein